MEFQYRILLLSQYQYTFSSPQSIFDKFYFKIICVKVNTNKLCLKLLTGVAVDNAFFGKTNISNFSEFAKVNKDKVQNFIYIL